MFIAGVSIRFFLRATCRCIKLVKRAMGSFACDLHIISESLGKQWWWFAGSSLCKFCCFTLESTGAHTRKWGRERRELRGKNSILMCTGVCKSESPLVGRKDVGMGSLFLWDCLIQRIDNDRSVMFEDGVGFDVPPVPYSTSQTQNTFWIHPFYLLSKCQHWFNSQFRNPCGKISWSLPVPSVAE